MRRSDREITDFSEIVEVMKKCDVVRLAMNDGDYPYILPLNFGMAVENGRVELYFHGAAEGRKYSIIAKDNRASFEMDCGHRLVTRPEKGSCTMEYESVIGRGRMDILPDSEKLPALKQLMEHYGKGDFPINQAVLERTVMMRLRVEEMTAKRRSVAAQG